MRYIKKVHLWEVSVVTFPANCHAELTCVDELKQLDNNIAKAIMALEGQMVGDRGLEPLTSAMSTQRSSQLS